MQDFLRVSEGLKDTGSSGSFGFRRVGSRASSLILRELSFGGGKLVLVMPGEEVR